MVLAAFCAGVSGCAKPSNYIRPRLAVAPDGRAYLSAQRMAFDLPDDEYRLFSAQAPDYDEWKEIGRYAGRVVALLPDERGLLIVHASGATIRRREDADSSLISVSGHVRLGSAALFWPGKTDESSPRPKSDPPPLSMPSTDADAVAEAEAGAGAAAGGRGNDKNAPAAASSSPTLMAVGEASEGLQLLRLDGGRWWPEGPLLPVPGGTVWQVQLARWGPYPALCWSLSPEDGAMPLGGAYLARGSWRPLPLPGHADGSYAAFADDGDGGLWWIVEGPIREGNRSTLDLHHAAPPLDATSPEAPPAADNENDDGYAAAPSGDETAPPRWRAAGHVAVPAGWQSRQGYGMALAVGQAPDAPALDGSGAAGDGCSPVMVLARSHPGGVHAWTARPDKSASASGADPSFAAENAAAPAWQWTPAGLVIEQERAESWAALQLALMLVFLAGAIIGLRLLRDRGPWILRAPSRPGATGALMDRALAFLVDGLVVSPFPAAFYLNATDYGPLRFPPGERLRLYWVWLAGLIIYKSLLESRWGTTLGKRLMGLRVRRADEGGGRIAPAQAWSRNLALAIDCFPVVFGESGMFWPYLVALTAMAFTRRRRRVGDGLAGTVVRRHVPPERRTVLLASASPRRLELLVRLGLHVEVPKIPPDNDAVERGIVEAHPALTAARRAEAKALRVFEQLRRGRFEPRAALNAAATADETDDAGRTGAMGAGRANGANGAARAADGASPSGRRSVDSPVADGPIVVAGDTVVVVDGRILDKPRDAAEAAAMLSELSGRSHWVHGGVSIVDAATGQCIVASESTEVVFRDLTPEDIDAYVATGSPLDKAGAYGIQDVPDDFVRELRGSLSNVIGLPMELLRRMLLDLDG